MTYTLMAIVIAVILLLIGLGLYLDIREMNGTLNGR